MRFATTRDRIRIDLWGEGSGTLAAVAFAERHPVRVSRMVLEELTITINTADRHVSNILTKIGASNRAEAASFAVRNGIA
jgi:hypothetical protein